MKGHTVILHHEAKSKVLVRTTAESPSVADSVDGVRNVAVQLHGGHPDNWIVVAVYEGWPQNLNNARQLPH